MLSMIATIALAQATSQNLTYAPVWRQVESSIRSRYYAKVERKATMDQLLAKYAPRAMAATNRQVFTIAVQEMIAEFGDSHFAFETNLEQGFYFADAITKREQGKKLPFIGAWFEKSDLGHRVRYVLNGSSAERAGLRPGDVVIACEGKPFEPISSFMPTKSESVRLQFQRGVQRLECDVQSQEVNAIDAFYDASRRSTRVIEHDGKRFAYGRIWSMIDRKFADHLYNWLLRGAGQNSDGLILDLRDGFGGRPENFFEPLFAPEQVIEWTLGQSTIRQLTGYAKPVIVIINEGTRSAKEVVSEILKKSGRATLVGLPTKGDVLGTFPQPIEDWAYLEIPMVDLKLDGVRLERNPVTPHITVSPEYSGDGQDRSLAAALAEISKKANTNLVPAEKEFAKR